MKNKIVESKSFEEKINLVELAPKSWSLRKIRENFGVSHYMARSARNNSDTSEAKIAKKRGKSFDINIVSRVKEFYQSDEVSRMCPGKRDCISIKENGIKVKKQKC